jgi:hypothetical protein
MLTKSRSTEEQSNLLMQCTPVFGMFTKLRKVNVSFMSVSLSVRM